MAFEHSFTASSAGLSAGVSIGFVIWLLRGGVLLSSLLAAMPAWAALDPLPILSKSHDRSMDEDEDDSLQAILKRASARSGPVKSSAIANEDSAEQV